MKERFGYCGDCINKGMCAACYRGSHYESGGVWLYNYYREHKHDEKQENN